MTLQLNTEEQRLLREVLDRYLNDLEMEILHTDHGEFKAMLKSRQTTLRQVAARLNEPVTA